MSVAVLRLCRDSADHDARPHWLATQEFAMHSSLACHQALLGVTAVRLILPCALAGVAAFDKLVPVVPHVPAAPLPLRPTEKRGSSFTGLLARTAA